MRTVVASLFVTTILSAGCHRSPSYQLVGQVIDVSPSRLEITIAHQEIPGLMPGMTMSFKVTKATLLEGRVPGDLISATLVVSGSESRVTSIVRTGHAAPQVPKGSPTYVLKTGATAPDADFIDETGKHQRLSTWRGQTLAVTFIYTRCPLPEFCPKMNRHFAAVQTAILGDPRLNGRVHLLSVSLDPAFDTPAVLEDHARRAHADPAVWSFLTGDERNIDLFAQPFGMFAVRDDKNIGSVTHNLRTVVIDGEGLVRKIFGGSDWTPADLIAALLPGE